jgi:hypothetical protein
MSTEAPGTVNPIDEKFSAGFDAGYNTAVNQLRTQLRHMMPQDARPMVFDERFITDTVAWAKTEMPMLKDSVDEKLAARPHQPEDMMQSLTTLVLSRLSVWLAQPDIRQVIEDYTNLTSTVEFYSGEFVKRLQGSQLLTGDQLEMPPLARGLAALAYCMGRLEELEGQAQVRTAAESQWAAAANMINAALNGEIENDDTTVPLIDRFQTYLRRLTDFYVSQHM